MERFWFFWFLHIISVISPTNLCSLWVVVVAAVTVDLRLSGTSPVVHTVLAPILDHLVHWLVTITKGATCCWSLRCETRIKKMMYCSTYRMLQLAQSAEIPCRLLRQIFLRLAPLCVRRVVDSPIEVDSLENCISVKAIWLLERARFWGFIKLGIFFQVSHVTYLRHRHCYSIHIDHCTSSFHMVPDTLRSSRRGGSHNLRLKNDIPGFFLHQSGVQTSCC